MVVINPFLKWAGGKRWLVSGGNLPIPNHFERYVEPFLGSGAVYFHLCPKKSLLSDINHELIALYESIKLSPKELYSLMIRHQKGHAKSYYYQVRSRQPASSIKKAARFLYLNRACWNGLYRVNLKGQFNVPVGTKDTIVFDTDDFEAISTLLQRADIRCCDFEDTIDHCQSDDFLFVDPPYTVQHNCNNFLKYNEKIFSWDDQIRLRNAVIRAKDRGVKIAVMNADHAAIHSLYDGVGEYRQLCRHSVLAGDATKRRATTEALFVSNISLDAYHPTPSVVPR